MEEVMRWDMGMLRRGFVIFGIVALVTGWAVYTADQVVNEVGRTVAFGLKPFEINVNRTAKGDKYKKPSNIYTGPYLGPGHSTLL